METCSNSQRKMNTYRSWDCFSWYWNPHCPTIIKEKAMLIEWDSLRVNENTEWAIAQYDSCYEVSSVQTRMASVFCKSAPFLVLISVGGSECKALHDQSSSSQRWVSNQGLTQWCEYELWVAGLQWWQRKQGRTEASQRGWNSRCREWEQPEPNMPISDVSIGFRLSVPKWLNRWLSY